MCSASTSRLVGVSDFARHQKPLPFWFLQFHQHWCKAWSSQSMIRPMREERKVLVGTGPPPGCSALALVSTWLCPLSASQRAAEWGSIETNSLCRTQLMGLPRLGGRGAAAGLWLLILPHKHARNLPPGICPATIITPPPFFFVLTWIHPKNTPSLPSHTPTYQPSRQGWVTGKWIVGLSAV